ncbi:FAD-dependent oxidoreductase [Noviherbaspirillum sp.]|uniref:FAD-dependent oxidoreductase n=1 Tax=Noviherbaspirillum sp. TaxID=1926288 RepID=UPI002B45E1EF|nr:FAD-dependent oxidoreductase [Noviherbaspirillum sp.]HJV82374.1 FAD-dependent oxidoreductase [Noviherbaspirillum sp.]
MKKTTEVDVVVIGGGGAGLAAAYEAAQLGRQVILIEKNPQTGGSTSWSVGSVTATNTPHQRKAGIKDSADAHFEDLALHAGPLAPRDNLALRRILVDNTSEMLDWLMSLGVVFVGPEPEPPHRVPRMHNVVPNSKSFAYHLTRHCLRLGVDIRTNTQAGRFIVEGDTVKGIEARLPDGEMHRFIARNGVVLASGDYSGAPDLKAELASPEVVPVDPVNPTATGDGHRMALPLGATVINGDIVRGPIMRFIPPAGGNLIQKLPPIRPIAKLIAWSMGHLPQFILRPFLMSFLTTALGPSPDIYKGGGVLINKNGKRFTDELDKPNFDVAKQPDRLAYIFFDSEVAKKLSAWPYFISTAPGVAYAYLDDYRRNRADIFHRADSLEGLAVSMGVPAENLKSSIAEYNRGARGLRPALEHGPFYALGPVKSYVVFTDGGLKVNESLQVLRKDGSVIDGLYAAGSAGQGGLLLEGHGHHLGWAFISGRIAGRNAAAVAAKRKTAQKVAHIMEKQA